MKAASWLVAAWLVAAAAAAGGPAAPERPKGKPAKLDDFKWADPWAQRRMKKFAPACEAEKTFGASEFLLDDLSEEPPLGLKPFSDALKTMFKGREYPGSWNGIDPHGYDRNLLLMEYADVPVKVKEWIEDQEIHGGKGQGLFAVYPKPQGESPVSSAVRFTKPVPGALRPLDKKRVVIFAPGAVYDILPLWVAESSSCSETLADPSKYSPKLAEGAVVAWPTRFTRAARSQGKREIEFTVKAQVLTAKEDVGDASASAKEEL